MIINENETTMTEVQLRCNKLIPPQVITAKGAFYPKYIHLHFLPILKNCFNYLE